MKLPGKQYFLYFRGKPSAMQLQAIKYKCILKWNTMHQLLSTGREEKLAFRDMNIWKFQTSNVSV